MNRPAVKTRIDPPHAQASLESSSRLSVCFTGTVCTFYCCSDGVRGRRRFFLLTNIVDGPRIRISRIGEIQESNLNAARRRISRRHCVGSQATVFFTVTCGLCGLRLREVSKCAWVNRYSKLMLLGVKLLDKKTPVYGVTIMDANPSYGGVTLSSSECTTS